MRVCVRRFDEVEQAVLAGCSVRAVTVRPGLDSEPAVSAPTPPERSRRTRPERFSRGEFTDKYQKEAAAPKTEGAI
jgi:hypothetical protein